MSDEDADDALVIDNGSWLCKAGFAGDKTARAYVHNVTWRTGKNETGKAEFVGYGARRRQPSLCTMRNPMERGVVTNWADMEQVWQHVIEAELRSTLANQTVLITETPLNPKANRERMAQVLFEKFHIQSLCFASSAFLSILSSGRTSGIAVDIGHGVSSIVPMYEGYPIPGSIKRLEVAGADVTMLLGQLMEKRGYSFSTPGELWELADLKERVASCKGPTEASSWQLPDGEIVQTSTEGSQCVECLFQPSLIDVQSDGISSLVYDSIKSCDIDVRRTMFLNVIMSGGSTMIPGLPERLQADLAARCGGSGGTLPGTVKVIAPPERRKSAWLGGSIFASVSGFSRFWKTRQQYEEDGPSIFHQQI